MERATIAGRQALSEDQKIAARPTLPKFQDSGGLSIYPNTEKLGKNFNGCYFNVSLEGLQFAAGIAILTCIRN